MKQFGEILLRWYEVHGRHLPWRENRDPYRIWISEIILQQTRVEQGMEYFFRFMNRFPDLATLAGAPLDEVMKYWQGLGYYSRARNLHAAACSMAAEGFPATYEGVRALKGVGDYTAAAICSFAYGLPCAVVDGNVYRVLTRFFGIETPIDTSEGKKRVSELAGRLICKERAADYNQAIMDFGATLCTPQHPHCDDCPLAGGCKALQDGEVDRFPVKSRKTKVTDRYFNYLLVRSGEYTYLNKRTGNDIWKALFELPLIESERVWEEADLLRSEQFAAMIAEGEQPEVRLLQKGTKHLLSHRLIHADLYEVRLPAQTGSFASFLRVPVEEVARYAVPRLLHAFLEKYL